MNDGTRIFWPKNPNASSYWTLAFEIRFAVVCGTAVWLVCAPPNFREGTLNNLFPEYPLKQL